MQTINIELILADLQMAQNIYHKLEKQHKGKKHYPLSVSCLKKAIDHLNEEKPLRTLDVPFEEKEVLQTYAFLTLKPILYVANIKEADLTKSDNLYVEQLKTYAEQEKSGVIALCAKLEEELSQLNEDEAKSYLQSVDVKETGLDKLTHKAFDLLNLITFLTTGEIETKAWTIPKNTTAAAAAGKIHTDIEKGFIRAEVITYEDMVKYENRVKAREAGKSRSEGRDYIVQDGDVILFYHN